MLSHNGTELSELQRHRLSCYQPALHNHVGISWNASCPDDTLFFQCNKCKEVKPIFFFTKHRRAYFGILETCNDCCVPRRRAEKKGGAQTAVKACTVCEQEKPKSEFYKTIRSPDGLMSECRSCTLGRTRVYREEISRDAERLEEFRRKQTIRVAYQAGIAAPDYNIKKCSKCSEVQNLEDFYRMRTSPDGKHHQCKTCQRKRHTTHRDPLEVAKFRREQTQRLRSEYSLGIEGVDVKQCKYCDTIKPLDEFHADRHSPDGKMSKCVACRRGIKHYAQQ